MELNVFLLLPIVSLVNSQVRHLNLNVQILHSKSSVHYSAEHTDPVLNDIILLLGCNVLTCKQHINVVAGHDLRCMLWSKLTYTLHHILQKF